MCGGRLCPVCVCPYCQKQFFWSLSSPVQPSSCPPAPASLSHLFILLASEFVKSSSGLQKTTDSFELCLYACHLLPFHHRQVLVLWLAPPLHPGGPGPACQIETQAGQRAAGRPPEGRPGGKQLQPEGESLVRPPGRRRAVQSAQGRRKPLLAGARQVRLSDTQPNTGRCGTPDGQKTPVNVLLKTFQ